jgi:hypothetical protein
MIAFSQVLSTATGPLDVDLGQDAFFCCFIA